MVDLLEQVLVVGVEPVRKHDGAEIDIPLASCRSVDDHGSRETVQVLTGVVTVPPGGSEEFSANAVGERGARSNRTLRDSGDTIVPRSSSLQETVPVDGSSVILKLVVDCDLDPITPVGFNHRSWELVVDDKHGSLDTVGRHGGVGDCPVILTSNASVGDLAWFVRVGVAGAPVTPRVDAAARLRAIEEATQLSTVIRTEFAIA